MITEMEGGVAVDVVPPYSEAWLHVHVRRGHAFTWSVSLHNVHKQTVNIRIPRLKLVSVVSGCW